MMNKFMIIALILAGMALGLIAPMFSDGMGFQTKVSWKSIGWMCLGLAIGIVIGYTHV